MKAPETIREWLAGSLGLLRPSTPLQVESEAELAPFQEAAVHRAVEIARRTGGVVLADSVGMGKTRTALAIARILARDCAKRTGSQRPVYGCVPSRLRTGWSRAAAEGGWNLSRELRLISHTEMSLRSQVLPGEHPAALIVDEAHAFRNPEARRSKHLAELTALAPVILVTATPVCNGIDDLYHLFALFLADHDLRDVLGIDLKEAFARAHAGEYDLTELVEHLVIRRLDAPVEDGFGRRPRVRMEVVAYDPPEDEAWIWAHLGAELGKLALALTRDEWPRQLFVEYVLKRWESGPDALEETLRRLVDYHARWLEADREGRQLSRADFGRLFGAESVRDQGVFSFVYDSQGKDAMSQQVSGSQRVIREVVEDDLRRLESLLVRTHRVVQNRAGAPAAMAELIAENSSEKFLIFSTYQRAAKGIYETLEEKLGASRPIGLVTGKGARATGLGKVAADEVVRRFAPLASGHKELPAHQAIDILVCTDCLSEGINLQDCSRVILADLPYSPLKIEQRIGRLVRPGSAHHEVKVYWLRPSQWEDTLGLRRRLDRKLDEATSAAMPLTHAKASPILHSEPLAALTRQDLFAASLGAEPWIPDPAGEPRYYSADVAGGVEALYLRVILEDGPRKHPIWCVVDSSGTVTHRLSDVLPGLIALADANVPLTMGAPDPAMLDAALGFLDERSQFLHAARLAPLPLPASRPQQRLWQYICSQAIPRDRLEFLRPRLLRPFPRGIERRLEELLEAGPSLERILRRLDDLPPLHPRDASVSHHILWGLQVLLPTR
ncbi:MAG: helicase-related protein [Bradymonadaceae bacterium]